MVLEVSHAVRCDSLGDLASSDDLILFNSFSRSLSVADLRNTTFADVPSITEAAEVSLLLKSASSAKTAHLEVNDLLVEIGWVFGLIELHRYNY